VTVNFQKELRLYVWQREREEEMPRWYHGERDEEQRIEIMAIDNKGSDANNY
jgi:hypothetical protein